MPRDKWGMKIDAGKVDKVPKWKEAYGPEWDDLRERALRRDGYRCRDCGCSVKGTSKRAVHHIIPLSKGGPNKLSNLKTECSKCHEKEHKHLAARAKKYQAPLRPFRSTFFGGEQSTKVKTKTFHSKKTRSLF